MFLEKIGLSLNSTEGPLSLLEKLVKVFPEARRANASNEWEKNLFDYINPPMNPRVSIIWQSTFLRVTLGII